MIESTGLLGSETFEIQETWMGQHQLEYANYALKNPTEGVEVFLSSVSLRTPKGYGINQHPPSRCTLPFQWGNPLSVVQEGRAEQGNNH